jgi:hypothetical protein
MGSLAITEERYKGVVRMRTAGTRILQLELVLPISGPDFIADISANAHDFDYPHLRHEDAYQDGPGLSLAASLSPLRLA